MNSDRLRTQIQFESCVSQSTGLIWNSLQLSAIKSYSLTPPHNTLLNTSLQEDSIDFYYKGLVSLFESIISINSKWFSWATVKIYYSIFYFLRSSLCLRNIGFIRKERDAFYFKNIVGESPQKVDGKYKTDHRGAIYLAQQFMNASDFLQTNQIDGKIPYEWIMHNRENINYKFRGFYEPDIPNIWDTISASIDNDGIVHWINTYLNDNIYSFLEDHAMLALPLRRLILTHQDIVIQNLTVLNAVRFQRMQSLVNSYPFLNSLRVFLS